MACRSYSRSSGGFQKKLPLAISGWALTHPWLDAGGCTSTCRSRPPPRHRAPGKALLLSPSLSAPRTPRRSREPQAAPPRTSASSSSGCFHPTAGLTPVLRGAWQGQDRWGQDTVPLPTSPGSPEWGCRAGFAPGSIPWDAGWLCGRAAGAEPCWKGLMERWPRTEPVNTAGAPRKCRPLLPLPARLPGPPPCPPCQEEDRDGTIEAIPPIPAHVSEHGKVKSLPGHCWRLSEWPPCLT